LPGLDDAERATLYIPALLAAQSLLNVHPDYVNAHMMFPYGPESVRIVYDWLFEPRSLPLAPGDLDHYVALWDLTNRQDARNCEWQQQGMRSREFRHGVYSAAGVRLRSLRAMGPRSLRRRAPRMRRWDPESHVESRRPRSTPRSPG
jgi:phenylpropionate dioxygenase-like ring-hydroxylating dioxygenase large terminal subunit